MDLIELLQKHDDGDIRRGGSKAMLWSVKEHDVKGPTGAGPKFWQGPYFSSFPDPCRTSEKALVAAIWRRG